MLHYFLILQTLYLSFFVSTSSTSPTCDDSKISECSNNLEENHSKEEVEKFMHQFNSFFGIVSIYIYERIPISI